MNKQFFKLLEEIDPNKFNMVYSCSNGMTVLRSSEYSFRLDQIHELKRENIKLQQKIDKAIKYIRLIVSEEEFIETEHYTELLDILKGENDE